MKRWQLPVIILVLLFGCKEAYNPPLVSPVTGYLVVDGFINGSNGTSTIILSRTTKLIDTALIVYEDGAQVYIEDENSATYALPWKGSGSYVSDVLSLDPAGKYRVHIKTSDTKEYISDFTAIKQTPAINSISWKIENDGVQIYVNAHDATNSLQYYQYKYSETWEFHSPFIKYLEYVIDPVTNEVYGVTELPGADTSVFKCWKTQNASNIILTSTEKLSESKIVLPVRYIAPHANEIGILYFIEIKQYALSKEAFLFKQKLKKNSEQLGTIFNAQPSELGGNIHCITNPSEQVIGYVEVTKEQVSHLFINNRELNNWPSIIPCLEVKFNNDPVEIDRSLIPTRVYERRGLSIATFYAADPICVDCTLRGTNVRPSFWP